MAVKAIPVRTNVSLVILFGLLNALQFLILPLYLLPSDAIWGLLLVPIALSTPCFWSVIHESFHGVLHPNPKLNLRLGRSLCIAFGSPFSLLRFGHLMHHKLSRTAFDSTEVYDPEKTGWARAAFDFYPRLLIALYVGEVLGTLVVLLPKKLSGLLMHRAFAPSEITDFDVGAAIDKGLMSDQRLREMRCDALAIVVLFAVSFWLYGVYWQMLLAALLARGFLISLLDNAPHYGTPLGEVSYSHNLRLPAFFSRAYLHFNLHRTHHLKPNLPWASLPEHFSSTDGTYDGGFARLVLRQLRGPVAKSDLPKTS